jgi:hypothetical protein
MLGMDESQSKSPISCGTIVVIVLIIFFSLWATVGYLFFLHGG